MDTASDVKIISMLGEVNQKVSDIGDILKKMQEKMNQNFMLLAEAHETTSNKLDKMNENMEETIFKVDVLTAGVSRNSEKIEILKNEAEILK